MIRIRPDDLTGPDIAELIAVPGATMLAASPRESCHFLPIDSLRQPSVSFWSLWEEGALKDLGNGTGEIKSMHTREVLRGRGPRPPDA